MEMWVWILKDGDVGMVGLGRCEGWKEINCGRQVWRMERWRWL